MDQNNTPNNDMQQQPPREPYTPSETPGGAQVYPETPSSYPPPPPSSYPPPPPPGGPTYPLPSTPPARTNRTWLIVLIVLLVLCCCCIIALIIAWNTGDAFLLSLCQQDPTLSFCDMLR